jgi:hypothetical protein
LKSYVFLKHEIGSIFLIVLLFQDFLARAAEREFDESGGGRFASCGSESADVAVLPIVKVVRARR